MKVWLIRNLHAVAAEGPLSLSLLRLNVKRNAPDVWPRPDPLSVLLTRSHCVWTSSVSLTCLAVSFVHFKGVSAAHIQEVLTASEQLQCVVQGHLWQDASPPSGRHDLNNDAAALPRICSPEQKPACSQNAETAVNTRPPQQKPSSTSSRRTGNIYLLKDAAEDTETKQRRYKRFSSTPSRGEKKKKPTQQLRGRPASQKKIRLRSRDDEGRKHTLLF